MAGTQKFGIGLIGLGIGQQHLLGYQRRNLHVAAICDKDVTRLNEVGKAFGINRRDMVSRCRSPIREAVMAHFLSNTTCLVNKLLVPEKPITNGRSNLHVVYKWFGEYESVQTRTQQVFAMHQLGIRGRNLQHPHEEIRHQSIYVMTVHLDDISM